MTVALVVTLEELKAHLNVTVDTDDDLIERKLSAAQQQLERHLGFTFAAEFPDAADDHFPATVPTPLREAVCQLAAHYYENREAVLVGVNAQLLPEGMWDVVNNYRNWSWSDAE